MGNTSPIQTKRWQEKRGLMTPNIRKYLITGLIWSFTLAIYQIWIQPAWNDWLTSMGHKIGVAETAMGFFLVWFFSVIFAWWISRNVGAKGK